VSRGDRREDIYLDNVDRQSRLAGSKHWPSCLNGTSCGIGASANAPSLASSAEVHDRSRFGGEVLQDGEFAVHDRSI
jgi:hypothetical protein